MATLNLGRYKAGISPHFLYSYSNNLFKRNGIATFWRKTACRTSKKPYNSDRKIPIFLELHRNTDKTSKRIDYFLRKMVFSLKNTIKIAFFMGFY